MFKKTIFLIFILIFTAGIFIGCSNEGDEIEEAESYEFVGTIIEIEEGSVLVEPVEGDEMLQTADRVTVGTEGISEELLSEIEVGSEIRVFYTGGVMESYPAQIQDVENIEILD